MEPEFQVALEVLRLRLKRGLSQKELAARVGTQQSGISRLERANAKPSLSLLQRVAQALNAHLEIRFVPNEKGEEDITDSEAALKEYYQAGGVDAFEYFSERERATYQVDLAPAATKHKVRLTF